jgi:hypothetical protein
VTAAALRDPAVTIRPVRPLDLLPRSCEFCLRLGQPPRHALTVYAAGARLTLLFICDECRQAAERGRGRT